jgi:hypothetical protein
MMIIIRKWPRGKTSLCPEKKTNSPIQILVDLLLGRISEPKGEEVTGDWRKLHYEELHHLYSPSNLITMNKSRRMRWARNVASMEEMIGNSE